MSFWSDSSPIVKGAIVVGVVALLYFGVAFAAKWPPFVKNVQTTQQRGIHPSAGQH